jgi:hypothetical protein
VVRVMAMRMPQGPLMPSTGPGPFSRTTRRCSLKAF